MNATTTRKPRNRQIRVLGAQTGGKINIEITQDGSSDVYALTPIANGFGQEFTLAKWDTYKVGFAAAYQVTLDGKHSSCSCPGHERYGYCRHKEGLQALVNAGKL